MPTVTTTPPLSRRAGGLFTGAGLSLLVPLASTVLLLLSETGLPTVAGTIALLVMRNLIGLAGALVLLAAGRRDMTAVRRLGVAATITATVMIAAEIVGYASINSIGAGMLLLGSQGVLAGIGALVLARARGRG